jgi:cysteine-rich repeat protein
VCDGGDLAGAACPEGGELRCRLDCLDYDATRCFVCGNGQREGAEACDTPDVGGAVCNAPGETGGEVSCTPGCELDRSTCWRCGNGREEPGEECDDGNGQLGDGCTPQCQNECGNGRIEVNEQCDDGGRIDGDGCSDACKLEDPYGGGGGDTQECNLEWMVAGGVAGPEVRCPDGQWPCDRGAVPGTCRLLVTLCFNQARAIAGDPPPGFCFPTDVAGVALTEPSLSGPAALDAGAQDALLDGVTGTLEQVSGTSVVRNGLGLTASPAVFTDVCGHVEFDVPLHEQRIVALRVTDAAGAVDTDTLILTCADGYRVATSVTPAGAGTITFEPPAGADGRHAAGTTVRAEAVPALGYAFVQWGGDLSGSQNPVAFTVTGDGAVTAAFTALPTPATHQRCIQRMNKSLEKGTGRAAKELQWCLRSAAYGRLTEPIVTCTQRDARGRLASAWQKTVAVEAQFCAGDPPLFGVSDAATVNAVGLQQHFAVLESVFGEPADAAIVRRDADVDAYSCQQQVFGDIERCQGERVKAFTRCKKLFLAEDMPTAAARLATCVGSDASERVATYCDPVAGRVVRTISDRCDASGVDLAAAFPGCAMEDPVALARCIDRAGACQACLALKAADGIGDAVDCDAIDDGDTANASCLGG